MCEAIATSSSSSPAVATVNFQIQFFFKREKESDEHGRVHVFDTLQHFFASVTFSGRSLSTTKIYNFVPKKVGERQ